MSEKKGWGSTVLGWFVVREGGGEPVLPSVAGDASADDLIQKYAADAPAKPPSEGPVKLSGDVPMPKAAGDPIDFQAVFRSAGVHEEEQGRIDKALALLDTLPKETPKAIKRQIVEASLKAFGYPVDQIIEAGAGEIQALQAYIEKGQSDTQKVLSESNARLAELEKESALVKELMERSVKLQYELTNACNAEKLRVQEVLEFFGQEAVARVVRESPKLHEPEPTPPSH